MVSEDNDSDIPIGVAFMSEDGVVHLQLRAEGEGVLGDSYLSYAPDHKDYKEILEHLGGLSPGQYKPVPAWPDQANSETKMPDNKFQRAKHLSEFDRT